VANRCESCSKFVSLETGEPEIQGEDLDDTNVTVSVRLVRNCAECSGEMKETTFDLEADVADEMATHRAECPKKAAQWGEGEEDPAIEFSLDVDAVESTERSTYGTNRKTGKPNKPYWRALKTYIGVSVDYRVVCNACGAEVTDGTLSDDTPASYFEDLN
jgi:hypothetical protein